MESQTLNNKIKKLLTYETILKHRAKAMFEAYGGALYFADIYSAAIIHRAINLLIGFCDLIQNKNILAAAPLIRMQLDNLLRYFALWQVSDPHNFVLEVIKGTHIRNIKDREGNKMTDFYLKQKFIEEHPEHKWISDVYEKTSGFIHFSDKHIFNSIKPGENEGEIEGYIGRDDKFVPDRLYLEALDTFEGITQLLLMYIDGWILTKDNPELVQSLRKDKKNTKG